MFTPNSNLTIWMLQKKLRLIRPGNIFQCWSSFSDLCDPNWVEATGVVFCCCNPYPSRFKVFEFVSIQRCSSAYLRCKEWVFELLLPFCQFQPFYPFSLPINKAFQPRKLTLSGQFLPFGSFSVNPREDCSFWNSETSPSGTNIHAPRSTPLKSPFYPILMLGLNFSGPSWPCSHAWMDWVAATWLAV